MTETPKINHRADIDGLRGIAVLAVVLYHAGVPFLAGGYVGVDVFFVISGYLISAHIYRDRSQNNFSLRSFYERRAKRILPALLVVVSAFACLGVVLLAPRELEVLCVQSITALTSSSNLFFWLRTNYFAPHAELKPMLMTWSLGVEEQFYIVFPLLVGWVWNRGRRFLLLSLGALSVLTLLISIYQSFAYPTAAFFLLTSRWWELGFGTILGIHEAGLVDEKRKAVRGWRTELLGAAGLAGVLAGAFLYDGATRFPGAAALLPVVASLMLLSAKNSWVNRTLLSTKSLVAIGLISYSLYLWHWPILSFAQFCSGDALPPVQKACLVALAVALATLSYFFVEQPFRRMTRTPRTLYRYAAVSALCSIPLCVLLFNKGWPARYPGAAAIEQQAHLPSIETCIAHDGQSTAVRSGGCSPAQSDRTLAILGDSHAASLNRYLQTALESKGWSVAEFTKSSCPPLGHVAPGSAERANCVAFSQNSLDQVVGDPNIKTVLLAGYWMTLFPPFMEHGRYTAEGQTAASLTVEDSWRNLEAGLNEEAARLQAGGKKIVIVIDSPSLGFNPLLVTLSDAIGPRRALKRILWNGNDESVTAVPKMPGKTRMESRLRRVAARHDAEVVDLYAGLCVQSTCRYALNGQPLFEDPHHLTRLGAELAMRQSTASLAAEPMQHAGLTSGNALALSTRPGLSSTRPEPRTMQTW
jgi:peptidoglycan/LPS O-acetylase OafA/YrhL